MDLFFVITTAIAVSVDSFFVGLGLGSQSKFSFKLPLIVALVTFILCALTAMLGEMLMGVFSNQAVTYISSAILLAVGLANFFKKTCSDSPAEFNYRYCIAASVGVGLDASAANFSLALMGLTTLWLPLFFALTHFVTVIMGVFLAKSPVMHSITDTNRFAGVLLIMLAIIKLI